MSFFLQQQRKKRKGGGKGTKSTVNKLPVARLRELQCSVCPLDKIDNRNPHIEPHGASKPLIYILGEAPGREEDKQGMNLVGASGELFHQYMPRAWEGKVRYNNVVRTRPPDNRDPTQTEIQCCAPSVEADIARSKPWAIVGLGRIPLQWSTGLIEGITPYRGRRFVVNIAGHVCWYFACMHPSFLLHREREGYSRSLKSDPAGMEATFKFDLESVQRFFESNTGEDPRHYYESNEPLENISWVQGKTSSDFDRVMGWLDYYEEFEEQALDLETTGIRPYMEKARILSVAIGTYDETVAFR